MIRSRVWATATAAFFFARGLRWPPKRRTRRWNWAPGRVLVREAAQAHSTRTLARCWLPGRVPAGRRRPPDSLLAGASPAQEARGAAGGNNVHAGAGPGTMHAAGVAAHA